MRVHARGIALRALSLTHKNTLSHARTHTLTNLEVIARI